MWGLEERADSKTLQMEYCQDLIGSAGCAGVRDMEVIRMIPDFLAQ